MKYIVEADFGKIKVVERSDYKWGVIDEEGNKIVPFGKYNWIDGFDNGLARVKIGSQSSNLANNNNKWGIINERGEEVLPVEYDSIWNFYRKNRITTWAIKNGKGKWRSGRCPWQANQRYDSHETRRMCNPTHRVVARGISSTLN